MKMKKNSYAKSSGVNTPEERKWGRATNYKREYAQQAYELLYEGASKTELARYFQVHRTTIYEWESSYPDFADAVKMGIDHSEAWWIEKGRTNLCNKEFNTKLYEINMMNKYGWSRRSQSENNHNVRTHEEWLKEIES